MNKLQRITNDNVSDLWKKNYFLLILFYSFVMFYLWNNQNFKLSPSYTDMIGQATLEDINVSARVQFYFKSTVLLFLINILLFSLIKFKNIFSSLIHPRFYAILSWVSPFAVLLVINQIFNSDPSYRFVVFFIIVLLLQFLPEKVFNQINIHIGKLLTLFTGLLVSYKMHPISGFLFGFLIIQILLLYFFNNRKKEIILSIKKMVSQKPFWIFITSVCLSFVCFALIVNQKVDLYLLFQHIDITRSIKGIPSLFLILPFFLAGLFLIFVKILTKNMVIDNLRWICFALFFTVAQFSENYVPSLLMMLTFFMITFAYGLLWKKKIALRSVIFHYTIVADLIISISIFYLINETGLNDITDFSSYFLPVFFSGFILLKSFVFKEKEVVWFYKQMIFVVFTPLILLVGKELFMILNNHSIFIGKYGYLLLLFLTYSITYSATLLWKANSFSRIISLFFTIAIAGYAIYNAYNTIWVGQIDFFEDASSANSIKRTFENKEIPLFQHFSAHNLNDYFTGLLYAFLNGSSSIAFKTYSCFYGLFFVLYYILVKRIFGSRYFAFLFVLFSSTIWILLPLYHGIVILPLLIIYDYFKKPFLVSKSIFVALLLIFSLIFRADTGVATLASLIVTVPFLSITFSGGRKKVLWLIVNILFLFGVAICLILLKINKEILFNNITLILEYLQSAQSWGFSIISKIVNYKFKTQYFIFPIAIVSILIYALMNVWKKRFKLTFPLYVLIFLIVYYIANFQRGLIRHSFMSFTDVRLSSFSFFIISLFVSLFLYIGNKKIHYNYLFFFTSVLLLLAFKFPGVRDVRSIYSASIDKLKTQDSLDYTKRKTDRFKAFQINDSSTDLLKIFRYPMIGEFRNVYKVPEEVFYETQKLKLRNRNSPSFEYSERFNSKFETLQQLIREKVINGYIDEVCYRPMLNYFLNQSSIHFFDQGFHFYHNKILQEEYINELKSSKCQYILVNNVSQDSLKDYLDLVPHNIRHYKIFQYIYNNYHPFVIIDDKTLWIKDSLALTTNPKNQWKQKVGNSTVKKIDLMPVSKFRYMLVASGITPVKKDSVVINGQHKLPVSFYDYNERKAYILIEKPGKSIHTIQFNYKIDSLGIFEYEYYPDVYSSISQRFNLKMLPYVMAQYQKNKKSENTLLFSDNQSDTITIPLKEYENKKNIVLMFGIKNRSGDNNKIVVQYCKGFKVLGEFEFVTNANQKNDHYLILPGSQSNWHFQTPDIIRFIKTKESQLLELSYLNEHDISY